MNRNPQPVEMIPYQQERRKNIVATKRAGRGIEQSILQEMVRWGVDVDRQFRHARHLTGYHIHLALQLSKISPIR